MAGVLERSDDPVAADGSEYPSAELGNEPGLDGLRGAAVLGVLFFHQGFGWASGGFLGVSSFFTLSGFLITTVFAASTGRTVADRLKAFWPRRARRLLPAAWAVIGGIVGLHLAGLDLGPLERADPLAALAQLSNWQAIVSGQSYADLFSSPSPLLHFWSLAIEAQFYVVFPVALGFGSATRRLAATTAVVAVLIVASTVWMAVLGPGDRSYYGTDTRLAEILVGVLAALGLLRFGRARFDRLGPALRVAGPPAGLVLVLMWSSATVTSTMLTRGGFLLNAVLTMVVIGAVLTAGPTRAVLSVTPLVGLGRISYGVYLIHWPVFVFVDADRTGFDGWPLFAARLAVTLVLSMVSFVLVEQPIRARRPSVAWETRPVVVGGVLAALVVASLAITPAKDELTAAKDLLAKDQAAAADEATAEAAEFEGELPSSPNVESPVVAPTVPAERLDVTVLGDSTALFVGGGLNQWAFLHPDSGLAPVTEAWFACAAVRDTEIHYRTGRPTDGAPECQDRDAVWPAILAERDPDVAVLMMGPHDVGNHLVDGGDDFEHVGQPEFDRRLAEELEAATRLVLDSGVPVVWVTAPQIEVGRDVVPKVDEPASDDARIDRYNEVLTEVVERLANGGEAVALVDLAGYLAGTPGGAEDAALRPDGVHFTFGTAAVVAEAWLAPELVVTARRLLAG